MNKKSNKSYFVYLVECADKSFYIGTTTNIEKRIHAHNKLKSGARYTKSRRPVTLKYSEKTKSQSAALKREYELKQLTRRAKLSLVKSFPKIRP